MESEQSPFLGDLPPGELSASTGAQGSGDEISQDTAASTALDEDFWEQPIPAIESVPAPTVDAPEIKDEPLDILDAWLAFEVLSPQSFNRPDDLSDGDPRRIVKLANRLPWDGDGETARPGKKLFYQIVLGAIRLDLATADLLRAFGDQRPERPRTQSMAALAVVTVDQKGRPAGENPVAVSSFGYGYQKACRGEFDALKDWPEVERRVIVKLADFLTRHDEDTGEILPITEAQISQSATWLSNGFEIPGTRYIEPEFAVRVYHWHMAPNPPEPLLLNSFFLGDLTGARKAVSEGEVGKGLRRYLGIEEPNEQVDLMEDRRSLQDALAPRNIPNARWPAKGLHSLVLLQQAAVNLAFKDLAESGILGVNGPPGTGKTTLLRDLVAGIVANRAEALCAFDDPESAFQHAGQIRHANSYSHLYKINDSLTGHEILVASANNKAVENVSREIPDREHVEATRAPNYFSSVADHVAGSETETWGIAAAVLGKAANRVSFYNSFWKDDDHGFRQYLWACMGKDTDVVETDEETGEETRRVRPVVDSEKPPGGREEALTRWRTERARYAKAVRNAKTVLKELESLRERLKKLTLLKSEASLLHRQFESDRIALSKQSSIGQQAARTLAETEKKYRDALAAVDAHKSSRPGLISRLLLSKASRAWRASNSKLVRKAKDHRSRLRSQKAARDNEKHAAEALRHKAEVSKSAADQAKALVLEENAAVAGAGKVLGSNFPDDAFWQTNHQDFHRSVAWLDDEAQRIRDECFASAFDLHKAFIGAAAKPIRNNLQVLFNVLLGSGLDSERRPLLPSLWSTFFLVVPVVSTTFASVNRMLGPLPRECLGWLLIDEAGQASPQMAVGAILRAKRALVVGDPLQIEPVVTMSNSLVSRIATKFGVNDGEWMAPWSSVQALADKAGNYAAQIDQPDGTVRVGAPLLVHRRCEEPMFGISNAISYANLMVQATVSNTSPIRDALGRSRWIDIVGSSGANKWCADEGAAVIEMLRTVVAAGVETPDIFIVSPFRVVAESMRNRLKRDTELLQSLSLDGRKWLFDRIGTVHTFQGKQAEAVVLLLGAQGTDHTSARQWASRPPNLVNVAVSRAKRAFYIVGNKTLWKSLGCFQEVAKRLP